MAKIELRNIVKAYDNHIAVHNFNLEIADKEFIIFVGPSGCGKSTTLRMIAGLEDITSGELLVDGETINHISPSDRDIAMVFQNYALYPHMTVSQNIGYSLKIKGLKKQKIKEKVAEIADVLSLTPYLNRKPSQLSGGQKQRVAMGRAMVRQPKLFLMDEPLSNLDAKLRGQMRVEIANLYQQLDSTFIYVTHDQTEAMTLGTRIVVMKDGVIQQVDTPQNLYHNPANLFVAGFIGTPPMNFIEGSLLETDQGLAVEVGQMLLLLTSDKETVVVNSEMAGNQVIVGIRPNNIVVSRDLTISKAVEGRVEVYEMFGDDAFLHIHLSATDTQIVVKTDSLEPFSIGEQVSVRILENHLHLFDKETGIAIVN